MEKSVTRLGDLDLPDDLVISTPKGIPIETIIELKTRGLNNTQIAKICGCSKENIRIRLRPLLSDLASLPFYKRHRGDVLALRQKQIMDSMDEDTIEKASLKDRGIVFGILYDKERLERGKSTANVAYMDLVRAEKEKQREIEELEKEMGIKGVRLLPEKTDVERVMKEISEMQPESKLRRPDGRG